MKRLTSNQEKIIKEIHDFVKKESEGFSEDDVFTNHILGVRNYAIKLARKYKANLFVVIISAYLHDIYHLQTKDHSIHEVKGAEFAKKYLVKFKIPSDEIELISKCILNHRGSKNRKRETIEEKIVACADAMDHINRFREMFYRKSKVSNFEETIEWMKGKMKRGWEKLELKEAKRIVKPQYKLAMKFLNN